MTTSRDIDLIIKMEAMKSFLGRNVHINLYRRDARNPVNMFLDFVSTEYKIDFDFFWTRSKIPELFILSDFNPPGVLFDMNFAALSAAVSNQIIAPYDQAVMDKAFYNFTLQMISDFLFPSGEYDISYVLLNESLNGMFLWYEHMSIEMEMHAYDEIYVVEWFFNLAHEFGHYLYETGKADLSPYFFASENQIERVFNELMIDASKKHPVMMGIDDGNIQIINTVSYYDKLRKNFNPEPLRNEIMADLIGVDIVLKFAITFLEEMKKEIDWGELFLRILLSFFGMRVIGSCKSTAKWISSERQGLEIIENPIAMPGVGTRFCFVLNYLAMIYGGVFHHKNGKADAEVMQMGQKLDDHFAVNIFPTIMKTQLFCWNLLKGESELDRLLKQNPDKSSLNSGLAMNRYLDKCAQFGVETEISGRLRTLFNSPLKVGVQN